MTQNLKNWKPFILTWLTATSLHNLINQLTSKTLKAEIKNAFFFQWLKIFIYEFIEESSHTVYLYINRVTIINILKYILTELPS